MTVINTNVGALTARTYAVKATANTETAMERLSSGLRINSAADDAAGLIDADKMKDENREYGYPELTGRYFTCANC